MAGEWKTIPLRDCGKWLSGGTPSKDEPQFWGGDIPWISAKSMTGNRFEDSDLRVTKNGVDNGTRLVPEQTILLLVRGSMLHQRIPVGITTRPVTFNQDVKAIVPRNDIDAFFLLYWFMANEPTLLSMVDNTGIGAGRLETDLLHAMSFPLPPLPEQKAIAHILGSLDDKIELNRKMNETLEAMARAIFKSWFVDFDPVRAKAEGREPAGMDAETAKLFPDSFQDSELGKIPKGWRVAEFGQYVDIAKGLSYKGSGLADAGMPLHNLNSVYEGGGYKHEGLKHYTGEFRDRHICLPGDVIVANTEQGFDYLLIGFPAIVPRCYGDKGLFTHHIYRLRPKSGSPLTNHFIYLMLLMPNFRDAVIGHTNGTTVNALARSGLELSLCVIPPSSITERLGDILAPAFDRRELLHEESNTLSCTRDALLPKLLSGEIKIEDAENFVEVA